MNRLVIIVFAVCAAISQAQAAAPEADFDGKTIGRMSFIETIKSTNFTPSLYAANPKPAIVRNVAFQQSATRNRPSRQPLIKHILATYNAQILHSEDVGVLLESEDTIVAFKLPGQILLKKDGKTKSIIEDPVLLDTIRLALEPTDSRNPGVVGQCVRWVAKVVYEYYKGKLIEKTIRVCEEYASEVIENPTPSEPPYHPYPQAEGFSPGCYKEPDGSVICE